jgi:hypothetical protein
MINEGLFLFSLSTLAWEAVRWRKKSETFEEAYWGERRGRARVERELKRITEVQLNTTEGHRLKTIFDPAYIQLLQIIIIFPIKASSSSRLRMFTRAIGNASEHLGNPLGSCVFLFSHHC